MQSTVTPAPGRIPTRWQANVIDTLNYKVDVVLTELRNENWQLEIKTWTPEHKWVVRELFLTMEELERFRKALAI